MAIPQPAHLARAWEPCRGWPAALQIYSASGGGTALFARVVMESPTADQTSDDYAVGAISIAMTGETVCGDAWSVDLTPNRSIYIVADGLGQARRPPKRPGKQSRVFHEAAHLPPVQDSERRHMALAKTRGAAVSIAEILHDKAVINYAGVGNIAGAIYDGARREAWSR